MWTAARAPHSPGLFGGVSSTPTDHINSGDRTETIACVLFQAELVVANVAVTASVWRGDVCVARWQHQCSAKIVETIALSVEDPEDICVSHKDDKGNV